ncbi:hypothetical protein ACFFLM_23505 [Deinococcus oregonensis]|uniref:Uncharacterized protein n=1 Tax=Deinococcus oregonensis TaxID=1805970 RepID=A0ABV6B599_9DEIO
MRGRDAVVAHRYVENGAVVPAFEHFSRAAVTEVALGHEGQFECVAVELALSAVGHVDLLPEYGAVMLPLKSPDEVPYRTFPCLKGRSVVRGDRELEDLISPGAFDRRARQVPISCGRSRR